MKTPLHTIGVIVNDTWVMLCLLIVVVLAGCEAVMMRVTRKVNK